MKLSIVFLLLWTVGLAFPIYSHVAEGLPASVDQDGAVPAQEHLSGGLRGVAGKDSASNGGEALTYPSGAAARRLQGWADGTSCWLGSSCNNCQNPATWWYSIGWTACGTFTCIPDGVQCSIFTCSKCCVSSYAVSPWEQKCGLPGGM